MPVLIRKPKAIILDIEGTIANPTFVPDKLTPLLKSKVGDYLSEDYDKPEVQLWIDRLRTTLSSTSGFNIPDHPSPKEEVLPGVLLGLQNSSVRLLQRELHILMWIWFNRKRMLKSVLYDEVSTSLHNWKFEDDIQYICLYSSTSLIPQKLMVVNTNCGNLIPLFDHYIGAKLGPKNQPQSYANIAAGLSLPVRDLLFITDSVHEANAASMAGCSTALIFRTGNSIPYNGKPLPAVVKIRSFDDLKFV